MRKGLLLATVAGFAALVGTGAVNAADKLKVGVTATLEGTYTVLGEDGMRGYDLSVEQCHALASGGSDVYVTVNKELDASASGGSDIHYKGNGSVTGSHTSGSGSISRKD